MILKFGQLGLFIDKIIKVIFKNYRHENIEKMFTFGLEVFIALKIAYLSRCA